MQEFSTKNKLLITGTPLQNSVEELWYIPLHVPLCASISQHCFLLLPSIYIINTNGLFFSSYFVSFSYLIFGRALLHFLDHDKFRSKEEFVERYKNLSSFDEIEVLGFLLIAIQCFISLELGQSSLTPLFFLLACKSAQRIEASHP